MAVHSVLSPKLDFCTILSRLQETLQKRAGTNGRRSCHLVGKTGHSIGNAEQLQISSLDLHENGPVNSEAWMEEGARVPYPSLLSPFASTDRSITFCSGQVFPMILVKLNRSQIKPKRYKS